VTDDSRTTTILEVDDDDATRYVVTRVLQSAGFPTMEAATGRQALELAPSASLVILDVHLPDMNGLEVARRLREGVATRHLPLMHLSATCTSDAERSACLESGADAYLVQPVEPDELIATVRLLLREASERAGLESEVEGRGAAATRGRLGRCAPAPPVRTDFTTERLTRIATTMHRIDGVVLRRGEGPDSRFLLVLRRGTGERMDLGATFEDAAVALARLARERRET